MYRVIITPLIVASAIGFSSLSVTHANEGTACKIDDARLVCAESLRDGKDVLAGMANPATASMLNSAVFNGKKRKAIFQDVGERETFRKSLESIRRSMTHYARRALRNHRRGRLSSQAYEALKIQYKKAVSTYRLGMDVYRAHTWQSPTRKN